MHFYYKIKKTNSPGGSLAQQPAGCTLAQTARPLVSMAIPPQLKSEKKRKTSTASLTEHPDTPHNHMPVSSEKNNKKINLDAECVGMTQANSLATRRCGNNDLIKVIKLKGGKKKGEVSDYTVLCHVSFEGRLCCN